MPVRNQHILLRRDENRAALTNPLKRAVTAETPTTVTTASGSLYRKRDIAKAAIPLKSLPNSEKKGSQRGKVKSPLEKPKSKHQIKDRAVVRNRV